MTLYVFDLDGTLLDTSSGILSCLRATMADLGLPSLDADTERAFLGPPLRQSFAAMLGEDRAEEAVAAYRVHYGTDGLFDATVYQGIPMLLSDLVEAGHVLAVATSKAEPYALRLLEHVALAAFVRTVAGDTMEGARPTKQAVLAEVFARLGRPDEAVVIGDRGSDVQGAAAHGVPCLGAGWGYALPGELAAAGAAAVYDTPADLGAALRDGGWRAVPA